MKFNLDNIHYRIRTDNRFKKQLRRLVILGGTGIIFIGVMVVVGVVFFSSAIISFIFNNAPVLYEIAFNYVRSFASSFMLEDLTAILTPLTGGTNVNEMKNLVTQYFDQLNNNTAVNFQSFQNFITTVKNSLADNRITNTELDLVRKFLLN